MDRSFDPIIYTSSIILFINLFFGWKKPVKVHHFFQSIFLYPELTFFLISHALYHKKLYNDAILFQIIYPNN